MACRAILNSNFVKVCLLHFLRMHYDQVLIHSLILNELLPEQYFFIIVIGFRGYAMLKHFIKICSVIIFVAKINVRKIHCLLQFCRFFCFLILLIFDKIKQKLFCK